MDVGSFAAAHLPAPPARVLEVGCGDGRLARALAELGHRVTAIDPRAPEGELFEAVSLEEFGDPGPFDAVVASRSLHHIHDLAAGVAKIAGLLEPVGRFIVFEDAGQCLADWEAAHPGLHGSEAMRRELDRHFTELFFSWTPTGFRYVGVRADSLVLSRG